MGCRDKCEWSVGETQIERPNEATWRTPSPTDADYFTQLTAWGYSLSDVEQIVTGQANARFDDKTDGTDEVVAEDE
ncbi:MAG: hypothetical protein ACTHJI_13040 [Leifsonia sp.]